MLKSMTGYGMAESTINNYTFKVEIKSLNGKFLDLNLRVPKLFSDKEIMLRNLFTNAIIRGTASIFINIEKINDTVNTEQCFNMALAESYYHQISVLADKVGSSKNDILRTVFYMPDVLKTEDKKYSEQEWDVFYETCKTAIDRFVEFRQIEGAALSEVLKSHILQIQNVLPEIEPLEQERLNETKSRLSKNLTELLGNDGFDKNRFEQEMIYYLERIDIFEEKNRLVTHCIHFLDTILEENSGRKLGFIAQEIGREINTIGSKANHQMIQKIVIMMKDELEKIKEQSMNIL